MKLRRQLFSRSLLLAAAAAFVGASGLAGAGPLSSLELEAGTGNHVDVIALGVGTREWFTQPLGEHWVLSSYVVGRVAYWGSLDDHPRVAAVYDFSVTPVLRLQSTGRNIGFFVDLGVGLHALTHTHINADRTFGSAFQFGEFLGPGVRFGADGRYEISVRVQHVSNGGIRNPNDGLTYGSVVVRYNFQ
jgi:lipid A 3-O-deacylase